MKEKTIVEDVINSIQQELDKIPTYVVELGVFVDDTQRKENKNFKGVTNADLMFIHENGSPLKHIPSRPVIDMTLRYANENLLEKTISSAIDEYFNSDFDISKVDLKVESLANQMKNYARRIIYSNDGRLAPNAPSTIAKKGDNHPLFDTGQLARSIDSKVIKK